MPVISPWAPAAGCRLTASMPLISFKYSCSSNNSCRLPWDRASGRGRVVLAEAGQARHVFVDFWIVFHSAGAERIEIAVDAEIPLRKTGEMTHHIELGQFGKVFDGIADFIRRQEGFDFHVGQPASRQGIRFASRRTEFEQRRFVKDQASDSCTAPTRPARRCAAMKWCRLK